MCDPVTALLVGSTATSTIGSVLALQSQAVAARYQAQVARANAAYAEQRALDALERGAERIQALRREGGQLFGAQMASLAAGNLDLGYGSPLDVLVETRTGIELDTLRERRNALLEAEDYRRQGWSYRAESALSTATARNALRAGIYTAAGQLMTGASRVALYRASLAEPSRTNAPVARVRLFGLDVP